MYHAFKNEGTLQVRFKNGEGVDDGKRLGVDARRDMAALKISGVGVPVVSLTPAGGAKPGEAMVLIGSSPELPWSAGTGALAAYRVADEVPGAGSGFKMIQASIPAAASQSGGALFDSQARALGVIGGSIRQEASSSFAIPIESVLVLADSPTTHQFAASLGGKAEPRTWAGDSGRAGEIGSARDCEKGGHHSSYVQNDVH